VRAFVTGGTGFIGGRLIAKLRERGDDVTSLVRTPSKAGALSAIGCDLVEGGVTDEAAIRTGLEGCDAAFHLAGMYEVGIPESKRPAMYDANVRGTQAVIDVATAAGVPRIVYVSTINAFGNTRGRVVDETYVRPVDDAYLSYYDETKFMAHMLAVERAQKGAPVLIAQPGGVYGPGDHSEVGNQLEQLRAGRLWFVSFPELGLNLAHVDDIAGGILAVGDRGEIGESYVLGGEIITMGEMLAKAAKILGRRPPRFTMPTVLIKAAIPLAPIVTRVLGVAPNLRELISAADGVTYWATDEKARTRLGYTPRDLETGLRQTLVG
jgi:nucleoside-diphosphate-sugar epimerase